MYDVAVFADDEHGSSEDAIERAVDNREWGLGASSATLAAPRCEPQIERLCSLLGREGLRQGQWPGAARAAWSARSTAPMASWCRLMARGYPTAPANLGSFAIAAASSSNPKRV